VEHRLFTSSIKIESRVQAIRIAYKKKIETGQSKRKFFFSLELYYIGWTTTVNCGGIGNMENEHAHTKTSSSSPLLSLGSAVCVTGGLIIPANNPISPISFHPPNFSFSMSVAVASHRE
jgi:hypothetical protein